MVSVEQIKKADVIMNSIHCGCYNCMKIFSPFLIEMTEFDDSINDEVAICPFCQKMTVVGEYNNQEVDETFLSEVKSKETPYFSSFS